jgi:hypothetical protein
VIVGGHGLAIDVPTGWEARIVRRETAAPVLHVASFPLHEHDGDFGAAATGRMRGDDRFLALVEYRIDARLRAGHGLFAARRPRGPRAHEFGARQLQVTRRGQLGWQRFFSEHGRAFSVYSVIAPARVAPAHLAAELAGILRTLRIDAAV